MDLKLLTGGLHVIPARVFLDVVAWLGLSYAVWTLPRNNRSNAVALAFTVSLTLATCGLTSRWTVTFPMMPLVFLQIVRRVKSGQFQSSKLIFCCSILLILVSISLSVLFPPLQLPQLQAGGPFAVGTVSFFLPIETTTSSSHSTASNVANNTTCAASAFNHSHIHVRLFYPTSPNNNNSTANSIPYLSPTLAVEFLKESMKAAAPPPLKPFDWLMHHWLLTELPLQRHATLLDASQQERFPLVVYSHGLMGNADLYSYQTMSLASQGMLVLLVNHLDGSAPVAEHVDGSRVTFDYDIVQLWVDGKEEEYIRARRARTDWRVRELIGATEALLALNDGDDVTPEFLVDQVPHLSFKNRIQTDRVFFMGHSFGGATVLTAAYRRPDLVEKRGGVIAHEPAVDWMPDDARRSLFPLDRLDGLESSQNFTGGTGGLEYHTNTTTIETDVTSVHELNLLILYSDQWRRLNWGESHILEEMHKKGRLGSPEGVSHFGVIAEANHQEFSDMCMITPIWLSRGTGATGNRNPPDTAKEIEQRTWQFFLSVLNKKDEASV